ncbi:hypothetical protein Gotur_021481 [Gossypium turneri]
MKLFLNFAVNKHNSSRTTIIVSISAVAFAVLFISSCMFIISRMRKPKLKPQKHELTEAEDEITTVKSLQYDFNTIRVATDHFSDANKLGQGGLGAVYKGTLAGGKLVAVKRLSSDSKQGDLEFKNEVLLMANLQHRNLVRLQGFCLEGNERLLTYEFVPNRSLDKFLFVKSNVFSYGVLVLEILSGQKNRAFHNGSNIEELLSFAWRNLEAGTALDLVDPNLRDGSKSEVMRCIHIGLLCVQENVAQRPNMGALVLMLSGHFATLPLPSEPALFMHGNT